MKIPSVIGNWKLNGNRQKVSDIAARLIEARLSDHVAVCVPHVYLDLACNLLRESPIQVGAQDVSRYKEGAYTGEVSADMVKDIGCAFILLGHSERRMYFSESKEVLLEKIVQATKAGLNIVFCVGENLTVRQSGRAVDYVLNELDVLKAIDSVKVAVAYEPVWAIGSGVSASEKEIAQMHQAIKSHLGETMPVLYGGSVNAANAKSILEVNGVDGVLVGGASLKPDEFIEISRFAN